MASMTLSELVRQTWELHALDIFAAPRYTGDRSASSVGITPYTHQRISDEIKSSWVRPVPNGT
jgi:hypothetical protein